MSDEPNGGTLRYRVDILEREMGRTRDRLHGVESADSGLNLKIQHYADGLEHLENDVVGIKRTLVSVQRALWGLVITGMTVAATLLSGVHVH